MPASPEGHRFPEPKKDSKDVSKIQVHKDGKHFLQSGQPQSVMCSCCLTFISPVRNGKDKPVLAWKCENSNHESDPAPQLPKKLQRESGQTYSDEDITENDAWDIVLFQVKERGVRCNRCARNENCRMIPCGQTRIGLGVSRCAKLYNWRISDPKARRLLLAFATRNFGTREEREKYGLAHLAEDQLKALHLHEIWYSWSMKHHRTEFIAEQEALKNPNAKFRAKPK